jgi:hypothetical protein
MISNMKWIVLEENPMPDNYIAIMAADSQRITTLEKKPCSVYTSCEKAMQRARELRDLYKVKSIRLFQQEGLSSLV